jgi:hypothetical protein
VYRGDVYFIDSFEQFSGNQRVKFGVFAAKYKITSMEHGLPDRNAEEEVSDLTTTVHSHLEGMKTLTKKPESARTDIDLEVRRIEARIETVSNTLTDSELELGASVRLSVELRELEAYFRGIRFVSGQATPWG